METRLKQFRQENQLSQSDVAEAIGIDRRQFSRYENERNELPIRYLKQICIKFHVSADYLLCLSDEK